MSRTKAWIAFGSNLGDRRANLRAALAMLAKDCEILTISALYSTEPVGYLDQDWFLNAVALISTRRTPQHLLNRLHEIEYELGRERRIRNGPRTIDLDILLYGDLRLESPGLTIPHPRAHERLFVVAPWAEVAPDLILPAANGLTLTQLRAGLANSAQAEFHSAPPW